MPEGLSTEDGQALDLDASEQLFARAMAAPEPSEPEHPAPPKREDPSEEELGAKYGWMTDPVTGERRAKRARGRPKNPARETTKPQAPQAASKPSKPAGQPAAKPDLSGPLSDFTSALWMIAASAPIPADGLRVKVRAQALVLRENQAGLVQGVNLMAQHNGLIRRGVEMLCLGEAGWVLPAVMALAPFAVQSSAVWRADAGQLAEAAAKTDAQWAEEFAAMQAAMLGPVPVEDEAAAA